MPKQIHEIKDFLLTARRKDARRQVEAIASSRSERPRSMKLQIPSVFAERRYRPSLSRGGFLSVSDFITRVSPNYITICNL
ncbi:hypothetical protein OPV22_035007 [Ensete ventricosum]|uniref:Uncharacterized protein n=1 Tax=Ensete ventricosum TaxID=4639 RepID=A0AAV8PMI9_ENSVE|nr:hypothetical protein OPV22_035007 [Ensete ventricosum]